MKSNTIKTDERIFKVDLSWSMGKYELCNLADLERIVKNSKGVDRISHLWDGNFKRISKKDLKAMLEAHKLPSDFLKLV